MTSFVTHVKEHLNAPENPCQCPWTGCEETMFDPHDFEEHIYVHAFHTKLKTIGYEWLKNKNLRLDPCGKPLVLLSDIRSKMGSIFQCEWRHVDDRTTHSCNSRAFENPQMFYDHVNETCAQYIDTLKATAQANHTAANFVCLWPVCDDNTTDTSNFKRHVKSHTKEYKTACPWCGSIYRQNQKLLQHINAKKKNSHHNSGVQSHVMQPPSTSELNGAEGITTPAEILHQDVLLNAGQESSPDTSMDAETGNIDETLADTSSTNDKPCT